jgi:hypothetical protein
MNKSEKEITMKEYLMYMCATVLTLCGLTFLLSSCDNTLADEKPQPSGKTIAVNLSFGKNSFSDGDESITRSSQSAPETVVVPLDNDFYMYGTLEPNPIDRRRTSAIDLENGTILHVTAYDINTNQPIDAKSYEIVNHAPVPIGDPIKLPEGTYHFTAHSSLNTTAAKNDASYTINPSDLDLMWGNLDNVEVRYGKEDVDITLKHMFSRVRVVVETTNVSSQPTITGIGNVAITPNYNSKLTIASGYVETSGSSSERSIPTTWSDFTTNTITSPDVLVYPGSSSSVSAKISNITLSGYGTLNLSSYPVIFNRAMESGKSYTLRISFKKVAWADSNIYWDAATQKLTFDPVRATGANLSAHHNYQGVYFKWGSLIGISPSGATFDANTAIYVPTIANKTWSSTKIGSVNLGNGNSNNWAEIPPFSGTTPAYNRTQNYLADLGASRYSTYHGDICKYIGESGGPTGYRMPNSSEFGTSDVSGTEWTTSAFDKLVAGGWFIGLLSPDLVTYNNPAGDAIANFSAYIRSAGANIYFPASGTRGQNTEEAQPRDGYLFDQGKVGIYWAGSPTGDSTLGTGMKFDGNNLYVTSAFDRYLGACPVRCVKE